MTETLDIRPREVVCQFLCRIAQSLYPAEREAHMYVLYGRDYRRLTPDLPKLCLFSRRAWDDVCVP